MVTVPFVDLSAQHKTIKDRVLAAVEEVMDCGHYVLGEEVSRFEEEFSSISGTPYVVGVGSCTDALVLSLKALGIQPGDEVITAPNSFLASASSIVLAGARPVFVDVRSDLTIDPDLIEAAITDRTRAIIPVHLTGKPADMNPILSIAEKHGLAVIEDVAQAAGATYNGQRVGSFGFTGCFSFHPLKNLNAGGDGGAVSTRDEAVYQWLLKARNHGIGTGGLCEFWGHNSRLDSIQAAVLRVKMKEFDRWISIRREIASLYGEALSDFVEVPRESPHERGVYQTYIIQTDERDSLKDHLMEHGVDTKIHYTTPIHLQEAARSSGYMEGDFPVTERQSRRMLSLPIYPELTDEQLNHVTGCVTRYFQTVMPVTR